MIHTIEINHEISEEVFERYIASDPKHNFKFKKFPIKMWVYTDDDLYKRGINKIYALDPYRLRIRDDYRVFAVVNLQKLEDSNTELELFNSYDLSAPAMSRFDDVMESLSLFGIDGVPTMPKWHLSRIDYCYNLKTPYADLYTALLNKGQELYWYKRLNKSGSNYQYCKSSALNFYSKKAQLEYMREQYISKDDVYWNPSDSLIDLADGILRIEVQYWRRKIHSTAYQEDLKSLLDPFISPRQQHKAFENTLKYLRRVGNTGRIYYKDTTLKKIESIRNISADVKEDLLWIAKTWGKQHKDFRKVREQFIPHNSTGKTIKNPENCFRLRIDRLNREDINPIYVTEHQYLKLINIDKKQRKEDLRKNGIPSVYTLLQEQIADQEYQNDDDTYHEGDEVIDTYHDGDEVIYTYHEDDEVIS